MDQKEGLRILKSQGWLAATPAEFRDALLSLSAWESLEPGEPIQTGGGDKGVVTGLASGVIELRSVLGRADTPIMHFARPVFWIGYSPLLVRQRAHKAEATAKTRVWLARIPQADVKQLLAERVDYWQYFLQPAFFYGDIAFNIAADLLIADSERRCAAVLLRLSGWRFAGPDEPERADVPILQEDLAGAASMSRNSAGTMLKRLEKRGLVELGHRGKTVCFPAALRAFVERE